MEEIANQSEVSTETQASEQVSSEAVTTQMQEPTGIPIKYNGADEVISLEEAPTWIQKGKNYDKVHEKATQLETQVKYLERRAKQEGFTDVPSYLKAIDDFEKQQQIEQEATTRGIDTDIYTQHIAPLSQENADLKTKLSVYEQQDQQKAQLENNSKSWGELYSAYPELIPRSKGFETGEPVDFFTPEMISRIERGYSVKDAYELAHKETLFKQKEQEVLARVTGRDGKQVLSSIDSPNNIQFDPANMSFDEIQKLSKRVQQGERITF